MSDELQASGCHSNSILVVLCYDISKYVGMFTDLFYCQEAMIRNKRMLIIESYLHSL